MYESMQCRISTGKTDVKVTKSFDILSRLPTTPTIVHKRLYGVKQSSNLLEHEYSDLDEPEGSTAYDTLDLGYEHIN